MEIFYRDTARVGLCVTYLPGERNSPKEVTWCTWWGNWARNTQS